MKKKLLFILISSVALFSQAQNASFGWALCGGGGTGSDRSADVVVDAGGNIFIANTFLSQATFNGLTFNGTAKGSGASYDNNLLITKLSPAKATLWSLSSNVGVVNPTALATTSDGDLIVTGNIRAVLNTAGQTTTANIVDALGTVTTFTSLGSTTATVQSFVAKFNSSGVIQWAKELNSSTAKDKVVNTTALASDADGNAYLVGDYTNSVILPASTPVTLTSTNSTQATFIAKFNGSTGDCVWSKNTPGLITKEFFNVLTYGDDGYLYAAGTFKNTATPVTVSFGDKSLTPSTGTDLVWLKFDVDGAISYIQRRVNVGDTRVKDMVAKNGQVFIAGSFRGDTGGLLFPGGTALTSTTAFLNGFTVAFSTSDGSDKWQKVIFSNGIVEVYGLAIGIDGNLFAYGSYSNKNLASGTPSDVDFGNSFKVTDATNYSGDLFLASFNTSTGATQEVHVVGKGTGSETGNSICSFADKLYMVGSYNSNPLNFENASTTSTNGGFDFYLVNYTVANPINGFSTSETTKLPYAFIDNINGFIIVKNSELLASTKLIDIIGRTIKTLSNTGNNLTIDTNGILSGIYIVQMSSLNGNTTSQRLLIK